MKLLRCYLQPDNDCFFAHIIYKSWNEDVHEFLEIRQHIDCMSYSPFNLLEGGYILNELIPVTKELSKTFKVRRGAITIDLGVNYDINPK